MNFIVLIAPLKSFWWVIVSGGLKLFYASEFGGTALDFQQFNICEQLRFNPSKIQLFGMWAEAQSFV